VTAGHVASAAADKTLTGRARRLLELRSPHEALGTDRPSMTAALDAFLELRDGELWDELRLESFAAGADERFEEHVAPLLVDVSAGVFEMGTPRERGAHFCGECPAHEVAVSAFAIGATPVTNELYSLFDDRRDGMRRSLPVTDVTWVEASLFALWLGCRLPTEAEWEYACGGGRPTEWYCAEERDLERYGWYSENSGGVVQPVHTREPAAFGLFDLHGNVWEWCADTYRADYYSYSPARNPLNLAAAGDGAPTSKVCRGGSMHALAEMCRTRFRQYEPADFWASDLGFRLVAGPLPQEIRS
jgi:formylglycine-generating enzyme required for sulfatase activity